MSHLERQKSRITGDDAGTARRNSTLKNQPTGGVPNAKKPRSRLPVGLRDLLPFPQSSLPSGSGPYSVGSIDIEVPVENPRTISNITRNGRHVLQLETVLFTLYYPSAHGSGAGRAPGGEIRWGRETWTPRPRVQTAKGYAKFAGIPSFLTLGALAPTTFLTKIRAFRNSPPATHWPPEGNSKKNGYKIKNKRGPPPEGGSEEPVFPLLMFSHGLGGTRTTYSSLCLEFASYGFVVCAVEHRDGSGPRTFINHPKPEDDPQHLGKDRWKNVDLTEEDRRRGYHHVDYVFPKNNRMDTAPNNEQGVDKELRNAQIELRLCELEEAYRVLKIIHSGNGEEIARQNLRGKGYVGGSSRGLEGVIWSQWKGRFHVEKMTMAGHSFGGATTIEVLRHTDRFKNVQAGIIYDIWGAPIKPPEDNPEHRIHMPLLGINSEAFMYWQKNYDAVMSLMKEADGEGVPAYLLTVRGSVHISQSDWTILYPNITSFFLKSMVHPQRAVDLNISASLEFLRLVTPSSGSGRSIINRCMTDESILDTALLDEVPTEHRPNDQWIAARLKVKNEFRTRVAARWRRRVKQVNGGKQPKGYTTQDEVWNHFKPSDQRLEDWIVKEGRGEKRIDTKHALNGEGEDDKEKQVNEDETDTASDDGRDFGDKAEVASQPSLEEASDVDVEKGARYSSGAPASDGNTRLSLFPTLRDGPNQDQR
ncbi:hypothetical protein P153DRAFT_319134 [Dothidotthia symphoricarpi CBS 119687]|uniref:1-alkyl-2-acetylglycerophosphocholine esterase n=1 Tax=Dothidotthia symphoricarpi CBS 119687 TaxID=1392245 RepID=A0A6A6A9V0_9PLEO|nr:uncharacterized protein P153DRAFT_319134 [Dothidotthia symphoricarpi CBS 119687]KAF2127973.1 hypothetical protein P153DRAFT_319134 [Dothidotthia symphoricarpi CBS 119687]